MKFIDVEVRGRIDALRRELGSVAPKKIRQQIAIATNYTAKEVQKELAREIGKELATTLTEIKKTIKVAVTATAANLTAVVQQRPTKRVPLNQFKARQTKKGVSVRISKTRGRQVIPGAFIIESYSGKVFKRKTKKRTPLKKLAGPSPWGVTVKKGLVQVVEKDVRKSFIRQLDKRIRAIHFQNLKRANKP